MMPLHRRHVKTTTSRSGADDNDDYVETVTTPLHPASTNSPSTNDSVKLVSSSSYRSFTTIILLAVLQASILIMTVYKTSSTIRSKSQLVAILLAAFFTSLPVILSLMVGLGIFSSTSPSQDLPHQRYIPLTVAATIVGNQLPVALSSAVAAIGITIFGLASRQEQVVTIDAPKTTANNAMSGPLRAVKAVMLLIAVLLTENFCVWVVSATYHASYDTNKENLPTALQDNGQIAMRYLIHTVLKLSKRDVVKLRNMISVEWILVSGLGMSLVATEMQGAKMKRNLWSMAMRTVLTLAAARFIRTISFLITVLPSQNPQCYFQHFPFPPPAGWSEWILEGLKPQVNGGCNDLIISGHATVTSTLACLVVSVVDKPLFTVALWMFVAMDYMVEVYEGFHYSVDMWLGALLVNFIWRTLLPIEQSRQAETMTVKQFLSLQEATAWDVVRYAVPAMVTYLQVIQIIPQHMGNYTIVVYLAVLIFQLVRDGFQQYTQHCLFCLLYMALGVYL